MPLHLPELLLLFCFARGVTFKELQDMACWNSGKDDGNIRAAENFAETQAVPENEYGLCARNPESRNRR